MSYNLLLKGSGICNPSYIFFYTRTLLYSNLNFPLCITIKIALQQLIKIEWFRVNQYILEGILSVLPIQNLMTSRNYRPHSAPNFFPPNPMGGIDFLD
jgi:hypothetical protein